jgi:CRP/FNR family cyclic AMP-dependent transcriptional regulator
MKTLDKVVLEAPIFAGFDPAFAELLAGCSTTDGFDRGEMIFREGDPANTFWLIRHGRVAIELHSPSRGGLSIETLEPGDVLGWSWLFPPYRWHYDARALEDVRAIAVDGACLRGKCDDDPAFGYDLMRRFSAVMVDRLQATRLRLLDIYGVGTA